jgi:hypothetical protein
MRAALLAAATVLLMSYPAAQEQATTAAAAEAAQPDETAAFLLATMYENGPGVPADPVAACVYYSRAIGGAISGGSASSSATIEKASACCVSSVAVERDRPRIPRRPWPLKETVRAFRVVRGH